MTSEAPGERWLTYREVGHLLGVGERAALNWVKEHDLPVAPGRPARVPQSAVIAQAEALRRPLAQLPDVPDLGDSAIPKNSEVIGSDSEAAFATSEGFGTAPEPIEAAYRVAGEAAAGVALVPLATLVAELRGLADQLADLARRNEGLALEVGGLRAEVAGHEVQLTAKDQTIATQAAALEDLREQLRAERLRAGRAEANVEMLERFYDPGRWGDERRRQYHAEREAHEAEDDDLAGDDAPGWWDRLLARFRPGR